MHDYLNFVTLLQWSVLIFLWMDRLLMHDVTHFSCSTPIMTTYCPNAFDM